MEEGGNNLRRGEPCTGVWGFRNCPRNFWARYLYVAFMDLKKALYVIDRRAMRQPVQVYGMGERPPGRVRNLARKVNR